VTPSVEHPREQDEEGDDNKLDEKRGLQQVMADPLAPLWERLV